MSNVAPITPTTHIPVRQSDPRVVAHLEELLEKARSGEIIGICGAIQYYDNLAGWYTVGATNSFSVVGALQIMQTGLALQHHEAE
mgnify:CR=1 FL=1